MINWDNVAKWRDELRSGKYQQTRGHLRDSGGYCCLGIYAKAVAKIKPKKIERPYHDLYSFDGETQGLPDQAKNHLGCAYDVPRLFDEYASDLNDEDGLTFDEIADLLDIALLEHEAGVPDKELIV
jgi:hypothetical protein